MAKSTATSTTASYNFCFQSVAFFTYLMVQTLIPFHSLFNIHGICCSDAFSFTHKRPIQHRNTVFVPITTGISFIQEDSCASVAKYRPFFSINPKSSLQLSADNAQENVGNDDKDEPSPPSQAISIVEQQIEKLQERLSYIEALEERNRAQLDSFVDAQDQWESLEEDEREMLQSKTALLDQMDVLAEELIQMWMGQKSMHG